MIGRPAAERAEHRAMVAAERKAEEKHTETPVGMKARAAELRRMAASMADSNDRNAMLRVANSLERQADEVHRHHNRLELTARGGRLTSRLLVPSRKEDHHE